MGVEKKDAVPVSDPVEAKFEPVVSDHVTNVTSATKLKVSIVDLEAQVALEEKVCANSEIREGRIFMKREILAEIMKFATDNKLELTDVKIVKEVKNKNGDLLQLSLKFPNVDGSYELLTYTIKGRHEGNQSSTSNVDQSSWDKDDMCSYGNTVLDYEDGEWKIL